MISPLRFGAILELGLARTDNKPVEKNDMLAITGKITESLKDAGKDDVTFISFHDTNLERVRSGAVTNQGLNPDRTEFFSKIAKQLGRHLKQKDHFWINLITPFASGDIEPCEEPKVRQVALDTFDHKDTARIEYHKSSANNIVIDNIDWPEELMFLNVKNWGRGA